MKISQYESLKQAFLDDDRQAVLNISEQVLDAKEEARPKEVRLDRIASTLIQQNSQNSEVVNLAKEYLEASADVEAGRASASQITLSYLSAKMDGKEAANSLDDTITTEKALADRIDKLRSAADSVELPPLIQLTGPEQVVIPLGTVPDVEFEISNFGDMDTPEVEISIQGTDLFDPQPPQIDSLGAGTEQTVRLSGKAEATETTDIRLNANSGSEAAIHRLQVEVLDREQILRKALEHLDGLRKTIKNVESSKSSADEERGPPDREKNDSNAQKKGNPNGREGGDHETGARAALLSRIDVAVSKIERTLQTIERDRVPARAIDQRIEAVIRILAAEVRHADQLSGRFIDQTAALIIRQRVDGVIKTLELATDVKSG